MVDPGSEQKHAVRVALFGFGGVNRAFAALIGEKGVEVSEYFGFRLELVAVVRSEETVFGADGVPLVWQEFWPPSSGRLERAAAVVSTGSRVGCVLDELRPHLVIRAIPLTKHAEDPAREQILASLRGDAHVVTATKSPLVQRFQELRKAASETGKRLRYSAATAAALPTVDLLDGPLRGAEVRGIEGSQPNRRSRLAKAITTIAAVHTITVTGCSFARGVLPSRAWA